MDANSSFAHSWVEGPTNCKLVSHQDQPALPEYEIFARATISRLFKKLEEVTKARSPTAKIHFLAILRPVDPAQQDGVISRARYCKVMFRRVSREIQKLSPSNDVQVLISNITTLNNKSFKLIILITCPFRFTNRF